MKKQATFTRLFHSLLALAALFAGLDACAPAAAPEPAPVAPVADVVQVREWPFWTDVPIGTTDYDRIWRTAIDVVSEHNAVAVMDKEGGYMRTEWKVNASRDEEFRYTLRIRPAERRIRLGLEVRDPRTGASPAAVNNDDRAPWRVIGREMQDRLGQVTPTGSK